jgi:hypothetical protein
MAYTAYIYHEKMNSTDFSYSLHRDCTANIYDEKVAPEISPTA